MAFVRIPGHISRKISDIRRCAYLPRWCASSEERRKAAYVSSTGLARLLASPRRTFFPPPRVFSPFTRFLLARWWSSFCPHCVAALFLRRRRSADSQPLGALRLSLFPSPLSPLRSVSFRRSPLDNPPTPMVVITYIPLPPIHPCYTTLPAFRNKLLLA